MKRGKLLMGVLCCIMSLFAFSVNVFAMDFDAEEAYESIFVIYSGNSAGSGFAIGENTVVTNAHVIANENDITIYGYDGKTYRASVYLIDASFDIAVLSVDGGVFSPLEIGDSDSIKAGDDIYAIGAPKSLDYTLTKGVVSNKSRRFGSYTYIQIDAAINSGNSGGPLLNSKGQVIGVNSMKMSDAEGIGLSIPISSVVSFMENKGVILTDDGNIEGSLPFVEKSTEDGNGKQDSEIQTEYNDKTTNTTVIILSILLAISVLINVIFVIVIMYRKNKNKDYVPPNSERTDFDIDFWG